MYSCKKKENKEGQEIKYPKRTFSKTLKQNGSEEENNICRDLKQIRT